MFGLIASIEVLHTIAELITVCPPPFFLNDLPVCTGGFERRDLEELIQLMDKNYIGWANYLTPLVMGANSSKALVGLLSGSFCSADSVVAKTIEKATFFSDHRNPLPQPTAQTLILQSSSDSLASVKFSNNIHQHMVNSELNGIDTEGRCLHMTDPELTALSIESFLG